MSHTAKYRNGITLPEVKSIWAHIFQARQFQGKGDFRYDISFVLTEAQMLEFHKEAGALALEAFPNGEYNNPDFAYPYVPVASKTNSPKLAEVFPAHFIVSAKAYEDNPPEVLVPQNGVYVPMPEAMRSQLVYDGAEVYAGVSLASYHTGANMGIRAQLDWVLFYGAGEKVAVGSRPDAKSQLAAKGINVTMKMQSPAGPTSADQGAAAPTSAPAPVAAAPQAGVTPAPQASAPPPAPAAAPAPAPATAAAPAATGVAPVPPVNYN